MAGPHRDALLQLSHHGRPRDHLYRRNGIGCVTAVARKTFFIALDVVAADAQCAFALHRKHRWLDYSRNRSPAVAHLWTDAYRTWRITPRKRRKRLVHFARFHGHVLCPYDPLAVSNLARD